MQKLNRIKEKLLIRLNDLTKEKTEHKKNINKGKII